MNKNCILQVRPRVLEGSVDLSGSKISAIVALILSITSKEKFVFRNFPKNLLDVKVCLEMIKKIGKKIDIHEKSITVTQIGELNPELLYEDHSIRYTLLIMASLLKDNKFVKVPLPGGCQIGNRAIDVYKFIIERYGGKILIDDNYINIELRKKLKVKKLKLPKLSTGGTFCALIMSSMSNNETHIENAHIRPEVIDIINLLIKMGAKISYQNSSIVVKGHESLNGVDYALMDDFIEAFTFAIFGATTKKEILIKNYPFMYLEKPTCILKESGAKLRIDNENLVLSKSKISSIRLKTGPYPDTQSELQPLFAAYSLLSNENSFISDNRFKNRYQYVEEFKKLGGVVDRENIGIKIFGNNILKGTDVKALDIRCGAALIIAANSAEGITNIHNANQIKRGYEEIDKKIKLLGGSLKYL